MQIHLKNISKSLQGQPILQDISLPLSYGEALAIIGPNGSGKSTLLRIMAGLIASDSGHVMIDDKPVNSISTRATAQILGFLSQETSTTEAISVHEVVKLGRTPWLSFATPFRKRDQQIVAQAMMTMKITSLAHKRYNRLSGGEKQRVQIARLLAQTPQIFLLDEPANHLDIHHQMTILNWVKNHKSTMALALHDLNHAFMCDKVAVIDKGTLAAFGTADEILVPDIIDPIFHVRTKRIISDGLAYPILHFCDADSS